MHQPAGPAAKAANSDGCQTKANGSAKAEAKAHSEVAAKADSQAETQAQADRKTHYSKGMPSCVRCYRIVFKVAA